MSLTLPRTIAHRGLSAHAPENTLAAVRAAHAAGCRWVELDVQQLGDGTPVIWHDAGVRRCSNGRGKLRHLDLAQARQLDVGSWFSPAFRHERMATLDEMLALIVEYDMGLNLELKISYRHRPTALVEAVVPRLLAALPPSRLLVSSFDRVALRTARDIESDPHRLHLGLLSDKLTKDWRADVDTLRAYSVHLDWRKLKPAAADAVRSAGLHLLCYTANDPAMFLPRWEWGVEAVISDDPPLFHGHVAGATS
ncbi:MULTISPECIES: glycerophosphodiester phosphodiesterase family protein [Chromohalobacter]|nr:MULTISPECIES: glycerophosphodiester phosphodiesterase family protein [Chromohalobacter]MCI0510477.1 glycerophosphoryl diester phosphodiesterase [Chromohalobacter sp.]MCI0594170.1 glycerophosphoryl diester phosphodiesterase [Chromohalobacter sp.]